jgi:all-trans-8'-apo-beta-carotenal 15,15'-oxygenase
MDLARYPDYLTIGQALRTFWKSDWPAEGMASLTRLSLDIATGKVESRTYDTGLANEFPTINPKHTGHRHRYAYILCSPADRPRGLQQQVAKVDLEAGAVWRHEFGPNGYPGEPLFIATGEDGEDDGVIVTFVFDAARQGGDLVCLDARDPASPPIFVARLKHHVPFGLHGTFTPRLF